MITVIQFVSSLSDGGAETLVKDYGIMFKRHPELKVRCIVVTLHNVKDSANYQRVKDSDIEVLSIYKNHNKLISLFRYVFGRVYIPYKFNKIIARYNPRAVHVHLGLLKYLRLISRRLKKINLFYTCHNEPSVMFGHNNGEKEAAMYLIKNNNLQLIALHEKMQQQLNTMFGVKNTIVVNNGIDLDAFRCVEESRTIIRESLGIHENAFVVGHIGRFSIQKNHIFLVNCFAKLLETKSNAILLLIGSGPTKEQVLQVAMQLGISDKIIILSKRTDIPQLLKCMDVFLFPSLFEGLSVTLVEAQASGLRCVISDKIESYNMLTNNIIQVSLESSTDEWCKAILNTEIKTVVHRSITEFDMEKVVVQLSKLYNK